MKDLIKIKIKDHGLAYSSWPSSVVSLTGLFDLKSVRPSLPPFQPLPKPFHRSATLGPGRGIKARRSELHNCMRAGAGAKRARCHQYISTFSRRQRCASFPQAIHHPPPWLGAHTSPSLSLPRRTALRQSHVNEAFTRGFAQCAPPHSYKGMGEEGRDGLGVARIV